MASPIALIRAAQSQNVSTAPAFDAAKVYGIAGFSAANYFTTPAGGGEPGDQAIGWVAAILCTVSSQAVASATRPILEKYAEAPAAGYTVSTKTTNATANGTAVDASAGLVSTAAYTIPAGNVGKLMLLITTQGGASGSEIRFFANNTNTSRVAMLSFTPAPAQATLLGAGLRSGSISGADGVIIYDAATYTGLPWIADVTAWGDAVRTAGDLSPPLAKATLTHRWCLKEELKKGGIAIADGAAVPAALPDMVTGQAGHAMNRQGSGLVVRVADPSWSYALRSDEQDRTPRRRPK